MKTVCVYCGSAPGARPAYAEAAQSLGRQLASRGLRLVYGGAARGTMGMLADAMLAAGGEVVGVIPELLVEKEIAHRGLMRLEIVPDMHQRKARMLELADAFVALPGGFGTLEELIETLTWAQLGLHGKPCALYNVDGYYDRLLSFLEHSVGEGFLREAHRDMLLTGEGAAEVLDALAAYRRPVAIAKWRD